MKAKRIKVIASSLFLLIGFSIAVNTYAVCLEDPYNNDNNVGKCYNAECKRDNATGTPCNGNSCPGCTG